MKQPSNLPRIGVSACLLGEAVRYDGGHRQSGLLVDVLGQCCELISVCPETELGMSVPRPPLELSGDPAAPRMREIASGRDWTARMNLYSKRRVRALAAEGLCGFVLKDRSPSCGLKRVKVFDARGRHRKRGRGLFASALLKAHPLLPMAEETSLRDSACRDNFLTRVFAYQRLALALTDRFTRAGMAEFHSKEKYLLMAHSPKDLNLLDRLLEHIGDHRPTEFRALYCELFMKALTLRSTPRKNLKVLRRLFGYLRGRINVEQERDLLRTFEDYSAGMLPLIVPLALLRHHLRCVGESWAPEQSYLSI